MDGFIRMSQESHIIRLHLIDLQAPDTVVAEEVQDKLQIWASNYMADVMDQSLADASLEDKWVWIDQLKIEMEINLKDNWIPAFHRDFADALNKQIADAKKNVEGSQINPEIRNIQHRISDAWLHFLQKGYLPWWLIQIDWLLFEHQILEVLEQQPVESTRLITISRKNGMVVHRLLSAFSPLFIERLLQLLPKSNPDQEIVIKFLSEWTFSSNNQKRHQKVILAHALELDHVFCAEALNEFLQNENEIKLVLLKWEHLEQARKIILLESVFIPYLGLMSKPQSGVEITGWFNVFQKWAIEYENKFSPSKVPKKSSTKTTIETPKINNETNLQPHSPLNSNKESNPDTSTQHNKKPSSKRQGDEQIPEKINFGKKVSDREHNFTETPSSKIDTNSEGMDQSNWLNNLSIDSANNSLRPNPVYNDQTDISMYDSEKDLKEGIFINNAGLTILHPFLTTFFEELGLTKEDNFLSKEHHQRAVCLCQYLATGNDKIQEHEMILPKILCGWPLLDFVDTAIDISDQEKESSDKLLKAVIQHWSALKNTSIEGLREGFLLREGKITKKEEQFSLYISQKTIDMLLNKLPWGISYIKLPWMKNILSVQWI